MTTRILSTAIRRRTLIQGAATLGILQVASPFIIRARADDTVKFGLCNPLTGTYAALGKNEQLGCEYAVEEINAKGGILGRQAQLLVEDSTSGDVGTAVQKGRKLIERDKVDFLLGNVNSAMSLALGQVAAELKRLLIVTGGHTDAVTGKDCHWNVFRVCNTTQMEVGAIATSLIKNVGKKWYFITADYAFGHTLQSGFEAAAKKLGGTELGADLTPLGTTDYSSYLIKAQAANPDVVIFNLAGDDMINAIKQAVQFGLNQKFHLAGAQQELEALEGLPPEARIGNWAFEWYWRQQNVPHLDEFVAAIKKKTGKVPTARTWFGYVAVWTGALAAAQAKDLDAIKMAKALEGFKLPPEVALMPNEPTYSAENHQLIGSLFVGEAQASGAADEDLFKVTEVVDGKTVAPAAGETGCKVSWPA
jgi:branched-chain amino acid transport system substrate-binding protein